MWPAPFCNIDVDINDDIHMGRAGQETSGTSENMKSVSLCVDCSELAMDEELALRSRISDSLQRRGIALVNGEKIISDLFVEGQMDERGVESAVSEFVARKKEHELR